MKKNDKQQLRQKGIEALVVELAKKKKELVETRFKLIQGQLKNVHLSSKIKNEIAVIKTLLTQEPKKGKKVL